MRVLVPLPAHDFDPTESAVPWRVLSDHGHEILFATDSGEPGAADPRMVDGRGLGPWRSLLRARADARELYAAMSACQAFRNPKRFAELDADAYDAIVLPGGHAPGMRPYLESDSLQRLVGEHMHRKRPLGAICHGVILAARAHHDGRSALDGRRTTALLEQQELSAWWLTRLWLGDYYRTYPETVQHEVTRRIGPEGCFVEGPTPLLRDAPGKLERGFTVRDHNYVSARWPGDAYRFALDVCALLEA